MKIRMMSIGGPRFRHAKLKFGPGWAGYDVAAMSDEQRAAVKEYLGRFIRVHPADEERLTELLEGLPGEAANDNALPESPARYRDMSMADLRALATDLGIEVPASARKKAEIIEAIERATR